MIPIVTILVGVRVALLVTSDNDATITTSATTRTSGPTSSPEPTRFEEAVLSGLIFSDGITLEDEGTSIVADGPPNIDFRLQDLYMDDLTRLFVQLDAPDYVIEQMRSTTALMGTREASWDGIEATWSYDPDNGLDVVLVDTQA